MEWLRENQLTHPVDLLYAFTCVEEGRNMAGDEVADMWSKAKQPSRTCHPHGTWWLPHTEDAVDFKGQLQGSFAMLRV